MTTTLASVRTDLFDVLDAVDGAQTYKHRSTNYQYPAFVVGWPQSMDVRPSMGEPRDFVIDVFVTVEVADDESSDDLLSELLEAAVTALTVNPTWDVQPATEFTEALTADGRVIIACVLPVAVFT